MKIFIYFAIVWCRWVLRLTVRFVHMGLEVISSMMVMYVSEVISEDACIRNSANVYVRFFHKPQGKFHDENMQNNSFNYIDILY